jgi:thiamine pyrophosphate-dependent acetolactate synthase large subunit-like protein
MSAAAEVEVLTPVVPERLGPADTEAITAAAALINGAKQPLLLLGLLASQPRAAAAVRALLTATRLPVVCTYQGAGVVSRELFDCFGGRVGLFHNQPADRAQFAAQAAAMDGVPIHPMRLVLELQRALCDDMTLCLDMGSFHIWLARHLYSFQARQVLISNGQQPLGVGLPWAIAACLVRPGEKVISISGDGGFLYSAGELETAVRLKCNLVHLVWIDGAYDMVRFQEVAKYGRASGVEFGPVDVVTFAESFGARGLMIRNPDEIATTLKRALALAGPVVVGIPVDYRDNHRLMEIVHPAVLN